MPGPNSDFDVAMTGATGLVGRALLARLEQGGMRVLAITRRPDAGDPAQMGWDPQGGLDAPERLNGIRAVVHLAGESIAAGRWTPERKERIRDSRVQGTLTLSRALAALEQKPEALVSASAIGFYGDRADEKLDESSGPGVGFLPDVCREWEEACDLAGHAGIRIVYLRLGVVLSRDGGALQKMLPPFKMGAGGRIGSGAQYWSWIHLDDVVGAFVHAISQPDLRGPVNAVAPEPVTNAEFTRQLGSVLHRPTVFPMPAFAARLALGEMADALLMASARVYPTKLQHTGYRFAQTDLRTALDYELHRA